MTVGKNLAKIAHLAENDNFWRDFNINDLYLLIALNFLKKTLRADAEIQACISLGQTQTKIAHFTQKWNILGTSLE